MIARMCNFMAVHATEGMGHDESADKPDVPPGNNGAASTPICAQWSAIQYSAYRLYQVCHTIFVVQGDYQSNASH
jgi:hypothetical protein